MEPLRWEKEGLVILDQSKLPYKADYILCSDYKQVGEAIQELRVRGAPAIGIAAAFGYALAAINYSANKGITLEQHLNEACQFLKSRRPTAINLMWALEKMSDEFQRLKDRPLQQIQEGLLARANQLLVEERERFEKITSLGAELIPSTAKIMTYCNAGQLATAGKGTALGAIIKAFQDGKDIHVFVPETRPLLQGARLTVWELKETGVPFTLITDNMAGYVFSKKSIDLVMLGADRIVRNGDFANKVGTYTLAVLASYHSCPFYVVAPISTFDLSLETGNDIPVEVRDPDEVKKIGENFITCPDCSVLNPSFDVTPNKLVSAYVTERGILTPPFNKFILGER